MGRRGDGFAGRDVMGFENLRLWGCGLVGKEVLTLWRALSIVMGSDAVARLALHTSFI